VFRFKGHTKTVLGAQLCDDGVTVLTGDFGGTFKIWNLKTGAERITLRGHTGIVQTAELSPDGATIVTGGRDSTIRLWDAKTGAELRVLRGHTDEAYNVRFSPDGIKIVSMSGHSAIKVWSTQSETSEIEYPQRTLDAIFANDWSKFLARNGSSASLYDAKSRLLCTLKGLDRFLNASFSQDGLRVATAGLDKTARVWDAKTGTEIQVLRGFATLPSYAIISPDGKQIVIGCIGEKGAKVWNILSGVEQLSLNCPATFTAKFSPDGTRIAIGCDDETLRIVDAKSGAELVNFKADAIGATPTFSSDGTRIVTAGYDTIVRLWDAKTGVELRDFRGHTRTVVSADLSPDGARVLSTSEDGTVKLWDAKSGIEVLSIRGPAEPLSASFSPDGKRVLCVGRDKAVIWDSRPYRETRSLKLDPIGNTNKPLELAPAPRLKN
jgi:WD40 repeat protein